MEVEVKYEDVIEFYQYFYSKISGQQEVSLRLRKQERVCVEGFVERVKDLFGRESLFNYFCFAFSKYEGLQTNQGKNNIPIMWTVGQKTFKEYQERDHDKSAYWIDSMKKIYRIQKSDLIKEEETGISLVRLNRQERRRFTDKDRQFLHCTENDLYSENSSDCILCIKRLECLKIES